jgi:fatty-acyl-CoA synthase
MIDGWMKTGDLGVFSKDGFLSIVGRCKDMIIRGGENVYPK